MSESEEEDEAADKVVELARSPTSVRSPLSPAAQNGDVDDVFLFDNNIPSIATRIPSSAEPADTMALRRRNRLLRLVSGTQVYSRGIQRSVSVQLDDRRRQHYHGDDDLGYSRSWANGGLLASEHLHSDGDDAEVGSQRQDGRDLRERGSQNRPSLSNGGGRAGRKKMRSVDACCTGRSEEVTMKRRGTLSDGKMVVIDDLTCSDDDSADEDDNDDDDSAEVACHLCSNGLDDQPRKKSSMSNCPNKAN